ncbi:PAS domain S-box protein, partial [bacterium]
MSLKILIVEDERIIAEDIRSMIESLGYRVIDIVDNGDMALELLAQEPADLVLMDIKIRGPMNGIETARQIYSRFDVPVIYLTAYADESTLKRIKETVAYGFIVKPASRQTIQGTIELAIYKHNMDCQLRERDERFEHLNRVLRAIRNVNQLIIKEMDRDRLLQGICNSLTETLGYQKTWIAVVDADNAPIHFGQAGFEETVNGFGRLFADGNWVRCAELAIGKPGRIIMNPRQECKKCRLYDDEKEYSRFSTRLEYGGKIYGLFSVAVPIRFVEDPEERELFRELACDIVFALYRIELEEKKQYAETLVEARERTLSTLMDNLPGMAYRCLADENWTMKFVSTGCRSLTGYWPDDLVDNQRFSYEEIIHPDDRDSVRDQVLNPVGENGQYELTYRIMTASGEIRWVWERGCFTGEKEGEHKILEGVIHDITEQKEAEEYLRQSEEKYRVLVENMTDAVFMVDCEKKVLSVNQSAARLLQKNADQVIGKTIFDLFPKELADNYHASIGHVFHSGKPLVVERKSLFANREIWLVASLSPIKDKNGNVIAVIGVSRDVSERKYAEQKLRESEARYRAIVEDQHEYIERWLPDGAITFVNESFCKSSGKTADEWLGTNIFDTLGESDRKRLKKKLRGLTPEAPFETDAYEEVLADGSHRWTEWTDRALFDENGKIREIQSVGRDITRRKIA